MIDNLVSKNRCNCANLGKADKADINEMIKKLIDDAEYFGTPMMKGEFPPERDNIGWTNGALLPEGHDTHAADVIQCKCTVHRKKWFIGEVLSLNP